MARVEGQGGVWTMLFGVVALVALSELLLLSMFAAAVSAAAVPIAPLCLLALFLLSYCVCCCCFYCRTTSAAVGWGHEVGRARLERAGEGKERGGQRQSQAS